jgi:LDH2 family malate/lactate/ureidoglycolate dehydrogenase
MRAASTARHRAADLVLFARALLQQQGLSGDKATTVAEILVEGDLYGHSTHGLQLLAPYLAELEKGAMTRDGEPEVLSDRGAAVCWDGRRLPGPWLVVKGIDLACERATLHGAATLVIRRSHHIACLAVYLKRATDRGLVVMLLSSDRQSGSVAPFGGIRPLYTPDPLAAGWPTDGDPVLIDISMSTTTNGLTGRLHKEGKRLPHAWLLDAEGNPTDDPAVLFTDPPGSILPLGGLDSGHKGYALGLMVEALTSGLGGLGRADPKEGWGASVFLQVFDPDAFGGRDRFTRETGFMAEACRTTPPRPGGPPVRLPGESGLANRRRQLAEGVALHPSILPALAGWAERAGIPVPAPLPAEPTS